MGRDDAAGTVVAEWHNDGGMIRTLTILDVLAERESTRQTSGPLGYRRTRGVEDTKRQNVSLPEQICYRSGSKLLLEFLVRESGGVADSPLQPVGPGVISGAVFEVGVRDKCGVSQPKEPE